MSSLSHYLYELQNYVSEPRICVMNSSTKLFLNILILN